MNIYLNPEDIKEVLRPLSNFHNHRNAGGYLHLKNIHQHPSYQITPAAGFFDELIDFLPDKKQFITEVFFEVKKESKIKKDFTSNSHEQLMTIMKEVLETTPINSSLFYQMMMMSENRNVLADSRKEVANRLKQLPIKQRDEVISEIESHLEKITNPLYNDYMTGYWKVLNNLKSSSLKKSQQIPQFVKSRINILTKRENREITSFVKILGSYEQESSKPLLEQMKNKFPVSEVIDAYDEVMLKWNVKQTAQIEKEKSDLNIFLKEQKQVFYHYETNIDFEKFKRLMNTQGNKGLQLVEKLKRAFEKKYDFDQDFKIKSINSFTSPSYFTVKFEHVDEQKVKDFEEDVKQVFSKHLKQVLEINRFYKLNFIQLEKQNWWSSILEDVKVIAFNTELKNQLNEKSIKNKAMKI